MKKILISVLLMTALACSAQLSLVNVGNAPNDPAADNLRTAFQKINTNFANMSGAPAGLITTNSALQTVLAANLVYVDSADGDDSSAYPGPYQTLSAAQSNAVTGDTIVVKPGTYSGVTNGFVSGVNWHFEDGATVSGTFGGIALTNAAVRVSGSGAFTYLYIASSADTVWSAKSAHDVQVGPAATTGLVWKLDIDSFNGLKYQSGSVFPSNVVVEFKQSTFLGWELPGTNALVTLRGGTITNWGSPTAASGYRIRFEHCNIVSATGGRLWFSSSPVPIVGSLVNCDVRAAHLALFLGGGSSINMSAVGCRFAFSESANISASGSSGSIILSGCLSTNAISTTGSVTVTGSPTVADWTALP